MVAVSTEICIFSLNVYSNKHNYFNLFTLFNLMYRVFQLPHFEYLRKETRGFKHLLDSFSTLDY